MRLRVIVAVLALLQVATGTEWKLNYFYDEDESSLTLRDIRFPSPTRGLAIGWTTKGTKNTATVLVTSDAGKTWTATPFKDMPLSMFCLDETACWVSAQNGIWFTSEAGRQWTRVAKEKFIMRLHFLTRERGFAVGAGKKLLETRDGGRHWTPLKPKPEVKTSEARTVFREITFVGNKVGLIAGRSEPMDPRNVPIWLEPEPEDVRERPTITIVLQTKDGGETWESSMSSMFGRVTRIAADPTRSAMLGLFEYDRYFDWPAELYRFDLKAGNNLRVLREKNFAITDIAVRPGGQAVAVGFAPPGLLARTPVPGRVRAMTSRDTAKWEEIPVDYRAVARRVTAAIAPDGTMWMATDTGMILKLVE